VGREACDKAAGDVREPAALAASPQTPYPPLPMRIARPLIDTQFSAKNIDSWLTGIVPVVFKREMRPAAMAKESQRH
jgi:hypothetical protein